MSCRVGSVCRIIIILRCVVGPLKTLAPTSLCVRALVKSRVPDPLAESRRRRQNSATTIIIIIELSTSHFVIRVGCRRRRPGRRPFDVNGEREHEKNVRRVKKLLSHCCRRGCATARTVVAGVYPLHRGIIIYNNIIIIFCCRRCNFFSPRFSRSTEMAGVTMRCDGGPSDNSVRRVPVDIILYIPTGGDGRNERQSEDVRKTARKRQNPRQRSREIERCSAPPDDVKFSR